VIVGVSKRNWMSPVARSIPPEEIELARTMALAEVLEATV
jgi:hypothetical protein